MFLAVPCYLSVDLLKSFCWLNGLSEVQITLDKMMESVFTPEFTDSETLFLGLFPQMPSSNAGISGARLKQIYCTELYSI